MGVALLFIDGVGVGRRDPSINPLAQESYLLSQFTEGTGTALPVGGGYVPVDACFGLSGRPQSASNQTALLTGEDAPALVGGHILGFPNAALRRLLYQRSIPKQLKEQGRTATFANCYPAAYLDALGLARTDSLGPDLALSERATRRLKASASTVAMNAGQVVLRTLDDGRRGWGLTHDIEGKRARAQGLAFPERTPQEAADIFWNVARGADFTLFEHFLADEAGHAQDRTAAISALSCFDSFARSVIENKPEDSHVFLCSDHGNVEDLSTRGHTRNSVPVLYFGSLGWVLPSLKNLADVGRAILRLLDGHA